MSRVRIAVWTAIGLLGLLAVEVHFSSTRAIPRAVEAFMREEGLPGAVLAYGRAGTAPRLEAFGSADLATRAPMTVDRRFRYASLSKPITAAAVMALVGEGALSLDDRLADHVPIAEAADPQFASITIRHLLTHTGGWDRRSGFDPVVEETEAERRLGLSPDADCPAVARASAALPLDRPPGSAQIYSNLGYCWLDAVIAAAANQAYPDYVRHAVLAPRGASGIRLTEAGVPRHLLVRHHSRDGDLLPTDARAQSRLSRYGAAGGWTGSAADYFRFAGAPLPPQVLSRPPGLGEQASWYGLSWRVWPTDQGPILTHSGFMAGVFAAVFRFPDDVIVVALLNGEVEGAGLAAFERLFAALRTAREQRLVPTRREGRLWVHMRKALT